MNEATMNRDEPRNRVGSRGLVRCFPPSFSILKQALSDDAFDGGEVACFGDYAVSWDTRKGMVAIADSGGWWTIPATDLKAIAAATPNGALSNAYGADKAPTQPNASTP